MSAKMKLSYAKDEPKAPNVFPDFEWSGQNRQSLYEHVDYREAREGWIEF